MKKILLFILVSILFCNVNAKEINFYYENENGVILTKKEYDFFTEMYYDGYQQYLTKNDLKYFTSIELDKNLVESKIYEEPVISTRATIFETTVKSIKISKAPTTNPTISLVVTWKKDPVVKSYDVMGAYLKDTSLVGSVTTKITYSTGAIYKNDIKISSNGFGVSFKIPNNVKDINISQTFSVLPNGTIFGSYQHAVENVTIQESKNYTIGYGGYGDVFNFGWSVHEKYDGMSGVKIDV